ncbi:MAG TPA: hypothetical protein VIC26_14420 [Marinagarivorans sp.]
MSKSLVAKEIAYSKLLQRVPNIVDGLGNKHPRAPEQFIEWLKDAETCLQEYNAPQASELAAVRSQLYAYHYQKSTRKEQQKACCESLPKAQSVVLALYEEVNQPLKEARKLLAPLLAAVSQSGAIKYAAGDDFQSFVERLSQLLNHHEQLKTSMVHVNALVPPHDSLWLLADMVDLEVWSCAA